MGYYFNEILALDFAAWLDVDFKIWIYKTIRDLLTKETKIVKNSISEIKTAEQKLTEAIAKAKLEGNKEALIIIDALENRVGRIIFNGVPTGVEVCPSMHHGGPYPASTDSRFTAVGTHAIKRWVRPVSYQSFPNELLPKGLQK